MHIGDCLKAPRFLDRHWRDCPRWNGSRPQSLHLSCPADFLGGSPQKAAHQGQALSRFCPRIFPLNFATSDSADITQLLPNKVRHTYHVAVVLFNRDHEVVFLLLWNWDLPQPETRVASFSPRFWNRFLSDPGVPGVRSMGPVVSHKLSEEPFCRLNLSDEDTNSILTDNANRAIQGYLSMQVIQVIQVVPSGGNWN